MPLKTILYLMMFGTASLGGVVYTPLLGVYAYLVTYNVNPLGQWWGSYLPGWAYRYSLILGLVTLAGFLVHNRKLRFGRAFFLQEKLLLAFLLVVVLSIFLGQVGEEVHYNVLKMAKLTGFILLASHIVTTRKRYEGLLWCFVLSGLFLAMELHTGGGVMQGGRLHAGVGGSDFSEGNFLAAHFGLLLPLLGGLYLLGGWKAKGLCLVTGVLVANSIVMTRSRGAFLALFVGLVWAVIKSSRLGSHRRRFIALMILGLCGASVLLVDDGFWERMRTMQADEVDTSAQGRLDAWRGALEMAADYPLGVGVGGFFQYIGDYAPSMAGMDTHNTYLRCLAELGVQGAIVLLLLVLGGFAMLSAITRQAAALPPGMAEIYRVHAFTAGAAMVIYLTAAVFISSVYVEEFYWLLMLPVFLKRALDNELADARQAAMPAREAELSAQLISEEVRI